MIGKLIKKGRSVVVSIINEGRIIGSKIVEEVDENNSGVFEKECPKCGNIIPETENFCPVCCYNKWDVG